MSLANLSPRVWILCLSIDLGTDEMRWFQNLQSKHSRRVELRIMPASQIVDELIRRRALREAFLPLAIQDTLRTPQ